MTQGKDDCYMKTGEKTLQVEARCCCLGYSPNEVPMWTLDTTLKPASVGILAKTNGAEFIIALKGVGHKPRNLWSRFLNETQSRERNVLFQP